jgi:hypothetical protein
VIDSIGPAPIIGVFPVPDDGRDTTLSYSALSPVPAGGLFDQCWAEVWPPDARTESLIRTVLAPGVRRADDLRVSRLNSTAGGVLNLADRYENRSTRHAPTAAFLAGLALGGLGMTLRRLEFAAALHAGVPRRALIWQLMLETGAMLAVVGLVAAPVLVWASQAGNPCPSAWLLTAEAVTLGSGGLGVVLGFLIIVAGTRESKLFALFKARKI